MTRMRQKERKWSWIDGDERRENPGTVKTDPRRNSINSVEGFDRVRRKRRRRRRK